MWRDVFTLGVTPALGLWLTWRTLRDRKVTDQRAGDSADRANATADGRLNLDALRETVDTLVDEVTRLKSAREEERQARDAAEQRARDAEQRAIDEREARRAAERRADRLSGRVGQLERALEQAHIAVPAAEPHDFEPDLD